MLQQQVLDGPWEEVRAHDAELIGHHVRLTIINVGSSINRSKGAMIQRGMFPELKALTDEDFKAAEWRGKNLNI